MLYSKTCFRNRASSLTLSQVQELSTSFEDTIEILNSEHESNSHFTSSDKNNSPPPSNYTEHTREFVQFKHPPPPPLFSALFPLFSDAQKSTHALQFPSKQQRRTKKKTLSENVSQVRTHVRTTNSDDRPTAPSSSSSSSSSFFGREGAATQPKKCCGREKEEEEAHAKIRSVSSSPTCPEKKYRMLREKIAPLCTKYFILQYSKNV